MKARPFVLRYNWNAKEYHASRDKEVFSNWFVASEIIARLSMALYKRIC
jgi:hypothetical protein